MLNNCSSLYVIKKWWWFFSFNINNVSYLKLGGMAGTPHIKVCQHFLLRLISQLLLVSCFLVAYSCAKLELLDWNSAWVVPTGAFGWMAGKWRISAQSLLAVFKKIHSNPLHYSSHIKKKTSKVLPEKFLQRFEQWLCVAGLTCLYYAFTFRKSKLGPC